MADALMQSAIGMHQAGRLAEAADLYERALRANPSNFEAMYALGVLSIQRGQFEQAQDIIGGALKLNPRFADGWCARGSVLLRLGRAKESLDCFDRALQIKPDFPEAMSARVAALVDLGRNEEALDALDRHLSLHPNEAGLWNQRGSICAAMGRIEDALECFSRALAVQPNFFEAMINRATMLHELGRLDEALAGFDAALLIDSGHAAVWNNRANTLMALKRFDEALESYDRALAILPDFAAAADNRETALLELKRGTRCPPAYLRTLFNDFSSHYDRTMIEKLGYRAHLDLRILGDSVLPKKETPWQILDLGVGTGLVGESFKDLAAGGRLDGIDLAPLMIEAARARGIYHDLILGDLETVLAQPGPSYDLILSADTMIYIGDLAPTFSGVFKRLVPGGYYLFACESKLGEGWEQNEKKRFRHSEAYIRQEAERAGLRFVEHKECTLRRESNVPVPGFTVALQKP